MVMPEKAPGMRRAGLCGVYPAYAGCTSSFGVAAYTKNTPHFSGLARLVSGVF